MLPAVDPSPLLRFVLTAALIVSGALRLVKRAASRYFVVEASFEAGSGFDEPRRAVMSVGGYGDGGCVACGRPATKKCSRCKGVRYCSQACQSKHWKADHRFHCKQPKSSDEVDVISSESNSSQRRKPSEFGSISLVPAHGTCNILQKSKKILFPYEEFVKLFNWDNPGFAPCGLVNCGNSCFANVVLQCLTCTRPLIAYLLERNHSKECHVRKRDDWCFLCELQIHVQRASESVHPFSPINILSGLPNIGGNLDYDRQEDAHEFMRFAIDRMQSVFLDEFGGERAVDVSTQETTLIQYIFGGLLQSQVTCTKCNMMSNRYENMMDLTVEIQGDVQSLEKCLVQFTIKEWLDGENKYKCDGCNDYVKAWKRLTVHQAPHILTIALKRFQSGRFGKLNKRVTFPENLDLTPYMSGNGDGTDLYTLYAVVVHLDMLNASFFGHYICYTKDYHGRWFRIDDCEVMNVEAEDVLSESAYMLLYCRRTARKDPFLEHMKPPGTRVLAETDQKASNTPEAANFVSASCQSPDLSCLPNFGEGPKLQDTGHDKELSAHVDSSRVKKLDNMVAVGTPIDNMVACASGVVKPILLHRGFTYIDDPSSSSLTTNNREEGNCSLISSVPEDNLPVYNMQLDIPYKEVLSEKCQEPFTSSGAGSHMEKSGSSGVSERTSKSTYALDKSLNLQDIVVATTKQVPIASITTLSMEPEPSHDSAPGSGHAGETCKAYDPANGLNSLGDTSFRYEGNKSSSCQENGSNGKPKPLFPRGFLEKSRDTAEKPHVENHSDALVPKSITETPSEPHLKSLNLQDIVVAATKQAPITSIANLSMELEPSNDPVPASEEAEEICRPSDPANRVNNLEDSSFGNEGNKVSSCQESCCNGKPKPLFSRGFLDKSGGKQSRSTTEKTQVESRSENLVSKSITERPNESMYALDESLHLPDIVVASTTISMEPEPSNDSVPGSEDAGEACRASDPANRVNGLEDASFGNGANKASSCQENASNGKLNPLFPCSFLDKTGRGKFRETAEKTQIESLSDALVPKENGFCNGHSDVGLAEQESSYGCAKAIIVDGSAEHSSDSSSSENMYCRPEIPCPNSTGFSWTNNENCAYFKYGSLCSGETTGKS